MAEYIKREDALEITKRTSGDYATAFAEIRKIPAADVAPVMYGSWERDMDGDWYCTNCDEVVTICESGKERTYRKPYCPNCGAKMNRGTNNEQSNWTENR